MPAGTPTAWLAVATAWPVASMTVVTRVASFAARAPLETSVWTVNVCRLASLILAGTRVYARRAVVERRKAKVVRDEQVHRPVKAAEDGEVAAERRKVAAPGIADAHGEDVGRDGFGRFIGRAEFEKMGDLKTKGAKAAAMLAGELAVDVDLGHGAGALEAQEHALAFGGGGNIEYATIPTRAPVVVAAILAIRCVPCVRHRHGFPVGIIEHRQGGALDIGAQEMPVGVEDDVAAWFRGAGGGSDERKRQCNGKKELGELHDNRIWGETHLQSGEEQGHGNMIAALEEPGGASLLMDS